MNSRSESAENDKKYIIYLEEMLLALKSMKYISYRLPITELSKQIESYFIVPEN